MKIISLNVNGIRSAARKGLFEWLQAQQADIVCLQEIKAHVTQLQDDPLFFPEGYHVVYCDAIKKGYSGVAMYARQTPNTVTNTLGFEACDTEGRYLRFDFPDLSVISAYFPSGTSGEARQAVKYDFLARFATHLQELKASGRSVILCGDINIAHQNIDLKNWRANQTHTGFLLEERAWLDTLFGPMGFVDAFRLKNPNAEEYTWWSNRGQAWAKNVGWRIDYQIITPDLTPKVESVDIYRETRFSDHAPMTGWASGGLRRCPCELSAAWYVLIYIFKPSASALT